jgi:methylated-DNA-[protein]-cysteine S-methyltransferase
MDKGIPCHRVIKSSGEIGGFAWGTKKKIKMLKAEGYSSGYKNTN